MSLNKKLEDSVFLSKNLSIAKELVYDICGFTFSELQPETESQDYEAFDFKID